jgi:hypothetical protein
MAMVCYVSVTGGFGNQLFCYALGRHLELSRGCEVLYDIGFYQKPNSVAHNRLWLDRLGLPIRTTVLNAHSYGLMRKSKFLPLKVQRFLFGAAYLKYKPSDRTPIPKFADQIVFTGYWHDLKCFDESAPTVCRELTAAIGVERQQTDLVTVAVHVRRGDYLTHKPAAKIDYSVLLSRARALFQQRLKQASLQFIIFSDDMLWCKENLRGGDIVYSRGQAMLDDFRMMMGCTHYVIANSTFSWWAAFLNSDPDKMVLIPSRWYADRSASESGLVARGWITIDDS